MTRAPLPPKPEALRELREAAGLSQTALAKLVYLSGPSRISDWEHGKHPIDPARWELLLVKLGRHPSFKKA
jgi:transcriptional regulator with XRE-family HTH domain